MPGNPLAPEAILDGMAAALPTRKPGDTTSDMSSSYEAIALFTHACMVGLGFRLLGFNEDQKMGKRAAASAPRIHPSHHRREWCMHQEQLANDGG